MKVAISSIRTKNIRIDRHELITSIQELGHDVVYIGQDSKDEIHSDYNKYNLSFLSIPIGRSNTDPFKELKLIKKTKEVIKEGNIDVLIVYGIRTFPTMVTSAKLAGVKKIICIVNGSGRLFHIKGVKGCLVKFISYPMLLLSFVLTDTIFFQNPDDMKMIKSKGLLLKKNYKTINGSGVNLEEYKFEKLEEKPVFSMISRLTGKKGVNEYVQAARYVKQIYQGATFYLIGPMDNDDSSINMNELQRAVEDGIIILREKVEDVRPYIQQCRFFVLPSYYPEGIPRSILEAMAMGRPIITTDSAGCRETVIDGVNGFLVPPRNPQILAEKMIWVIEHKEESIEMGKQSRILCEEKFDVEKINNVLIENI